MFHHRTDFDSESIKSSNNIVNEAITIILLYMDLQGFNFSIAVTTVYSENLDNLFSV